LIYWSPCLVNWSQCYTCPPYHTWLQYSLAWFINLFVRGIEEAPKAKSVEERTEHLNDYFTYSL
jgi:hypothetical protein